MKIKQLLCMISLGASFIANAAEFSLASTDIAQDQPLTRREVFKGFGCDGDNVSPQLSWRDAPEGTKSYAITVFDPDAPTGSGEAWVQTCPLERCRGVPIMVNLGSAAFAHPRVTIPIITNSLCGL
jgi:hypothetical protein